VLEHFQIPANFW